MSTRPPGTRLEETEQIFSRVEDVIREVVPADDLAMVIDNIGTPNGINLAFSDNATISSADGEILVSLKPDHRGSTPNYVKALRQKLAARFPDLSFYFQPADIVSQILNFGLPAPIDIQVAGYADKPNYAIAREIEARVKQIPGAVDVGSASSHQRAGNAGQSRSNPRPGTRLHRARRRQQPLDFAQRQPGRSLQISGPIRNTGINYPVAIQTPQHLVDSVDALLSTSLGRKGSGASAASEQRRIARSRRDTGGGEPHQHAAGLRYLRQCAGRRSRSRLGSGHKDRQRSFAPKLPPGSTISVRGQVESMNTAFSKLGLGLIFAAALIYFLMVVNFQSWTDPFIIITALPGAFAGIVWMLFLTHTTFNVESMMGAIMSIGVATANSILMITFANEQLREGTNRARRRHRRRSHPVASGPDDRARHDHRHGADGARTW